MGAVSTGEHLHTKKANARLLISLVTLIWSIVGAIAASFPKLSFSSIEPSDHSLFQFQTNQFRDFY